MMKRECLLSRAYADAPLTFNGAPIYYSALVNELMRELQNALFSKGSDGSQTEHLALVECVMVMHLTATGDRPALKGYLSMDRPARNTRCVEFFLDHEEEIERIKPEILDRLQSAAAAAVESEVAGGKPPVPAPESSP